jgi:hypothetical protein
MRSSRVSARQLQEIREHLSGRDLSIVQMVADLRLMSGRQLESVFFRLNGHESPAAAARAARRSLTRLVNLRVLTRMGRQIGGIRAGSKAYVYALDAVGARLTGNDTRAYAHQPGPLFVDHTLATSEVIVRIVEAQAHERCRLLQWQGEPTCWRSFRSMGTSLIVRPDLFVALGVGEYEYRIFIEVDRATQHVPTILKKAKLYERYYQSGIEQEHEEVFPQVLFVAPDAHRADELSLALRSRRNAPAHLYSVTTEEQLLDLVLRGMA